MSAENFLATLRKVRRTGPGRWIACCPAHDDKNPSMTVSEGREGGVVVYCHSEGCSFEAIVEASGVDPAEMYPPKSPRYDGRPPAPRPVHAEDALKAVSHEVLVAAIIVNDIIRLHKEAGFTDDDLAVILAVDEPTAQRLLTCSARITRTAELATGKSLQVHEDARKIIEAAKLRPEEERDLEELMP